MSTVGLLDPDNVSVNQRTKLKVRIGEPAISVEQRLRTFEGVVQFK